MSTSPIITQLIDLESGRAFPNQFEITVSDSQDQAATSLAQNFSFYATKMSLGSYNLEQERIQSIQHTIIKKATVPDTISLTVKETQDWATLKYFYKWYTSYYYDPTNNLFRIGREGKRKTFTIYALTPPYIMTSVASEITDKQTYGMKLVVKDALLVGAINLPTFDYGVSDPVEHVITLQSDSITVEIGGTRIPAITGFNSER